MPRKRKFGIFILFGSGFVCIAFATLRVIQLGVDRRGKTTIPEPDWLLLWTVVECAMGTSIMKTFTKTGICVTNAKSSRHYWMFSCLYRHDS